jgi:hypothetical protein
MRRKVCSTHESAVQYLQNFDRKNLMVRDYLKGLGVERRFTLMWIAENMVRNLMNGSISSGQGPPSGSGAQNNGYCVTKTIWIFCTFWATINISNKTRLHVQPMCFLYCYLPATPPSYVRFLYSRVRQVRTDVSDKRSASIFCSKD